MKKPKRGELNKEQKKSNKELASTRIIIEHVNRSLKVFKILSDFSDRRSVRYRNRCRRFGLRFNLIAALYNFELKLVRNSSD